MTNALETHFGHSTFRLGHLEVLHSILGGNNIIGGSGGGKDTCVFWATGWVLSCLFGSGMALFPRFFVCIVVCLFWWYYSYIWLHRAILILILIIPFPMLNWNWCAQKITQRREEYVLSAPTPVPESGGHCHFSLDIIDGGPWVWIMWKIYVIIYAH